MVNSNIAINSTTNVSEKKQELEANWDYFINSNQKPSNIRSKVYQSWKRCQSYGLDPRQRQSSVILPDNKLSELVYKSNLYNVSLPVLEELEKQTRGTEHLLTLSDSGGRIIHLQGDDNILNKAGDMNFVLGADWSEKAAGSNAIGTCIATREPIQILAYEHFCEGVHPWTCSAAPIKDPLTGELLGVFDLTGPSDLIQPHSLGLAESISFLIQQRFIKISHEIRNHLQKCYDEAVKKWQSGSTIVFDAMLNVIMADQKCLSLLKIDDWRQLWLDSRFEQLNTAILTSNEKELEIYLASLQLNVYIRSIIKENKQIGFLVHLDKCQRNPSPQPVYDGVWKELIGKSKAFKHVVQQAQIAAPTNVPLLITGESGTGKEQFAQAIHKTSLRHSSPFLAVNCGAIPKELMSSELFGYKPGAFTGGHPKGKKGKFEEAQGGTLLLDEIGEMSLDLQVYLLRVLQEKEIIPLGSSQPIPIDVRVIAATNKNMNELIDNGYFRADLYFRLNVVQFKLPPLRKRMEDIVILCNHFIEKSAKKLDKPIPAIDDEVLTRLYRYEWPGNIRELENAMEHAVLFCKNNYITISSLPDTLIYCEQGETKRETSESLTLLEQEERHKIKQLLVETENNISEVARQCGIARTTLYRKIKKYKLQ